MTLQDDIYDSEQELYREYNEILTLLKQFKKDISNYIKLRNETERTTIIRDL